MTRNVSGIPAAIDYLVGLGNQLKESGDFPGLVVNDGWPGAMAPLMYTVGADRPPTEPQGTQADGSASWKGLGNLTVEENFGVPGYIYSATGGAQTACRLAAFAVWDAWFPLFRADLSLGGALSTFPAGITNFRVEGPKSVEEAGDGRYCLILFTVQCENRY
jgi:hypothetical protein